MFKTIKKTKFIAMIVLLGIFGFFANLIIQEKNTAYERSQKGYLPGAGTANADIPFSGGGNTGGDGGGGGGS